MRDSRSEQTKHIGLTNLISSKPVISNDKYSCSPNWGGEAVDGKLAWILVGFFLMLLSSGS